MFEKAEWITDPSKAGKNDAKESAAHSKTLASGEVVASVINPEGRFDPAPLFRKDFCASKPVRKAVLNVSAAGLYRLSVNGEDLRYSLFDPGWTDYRTRIQYQTYDVTRLIRNENRIEILAGCGWAVAGLLGAGEHFFSDRPCVAAQLDILYGDGTTETVVTDSGWDVYHSFLLFSHPYQGEVIDCSKAPELAGHAVPAEISSRPVPQEKEPVAEHERFPARSMFKTPEGDTVIDFGQNMAGYVEVKFRGHKGDRIVIRHAETLDKGCFYTKNLRTAAQRQEYTLGHDGAAVLKPVFTFQGFRYIAVETEPEHEIRAEDFTAVAVYTDMKRTGTVETGNEMVNRLCSCILWSMRSNFLEVPTDCPQRDERLGWLGDAQVFCTSASFYYDVYRFYASWMRDVISGQREDGGIPAIAPYNRNAKPFRVSAAWADAVTIIPMTLYMQYGDPSILEECYPAMRRYVEYLRSAGPEECLWLEGNHYGDWLALDGPDPRHPKTDKDMIASAYYFHSVELLIRASEILGKPVEVIEEMKSLRDRIRVAFRERFLNVQDTYASCAVLLSFGLLEPQECPAVAARLAEMVEENGNRLMAGVIGAPLILHALSENGYTGKAYDVLLEESVPSWMGMIRYGGTTLWERLDTFTDEGMKDIRNASLNHYMFGSVLDWIVGGAGGLKVLEPGYRRFSWKPLPDRRVGRLSLSLQTRSGLIRAAWEISGGEVCYHLEAPEGTEAEITLPGGKEYSAVTGVFRAEEPAEA